MTRKLIFVFGCMLLNASYAETLTPSSTVADPDMEKQLISRIHQTNQMEIQLGDLALERAQSNKTKDYARRLKRDHQVADSKLAAVAQSRSLPFEATPQNPTDQAKMEQHLNEMARLKELKGSDFDEEFAKTMQTGHAEGIAMLNDVRYRFPKGTPMRKYIDETVPLLKKHQKTAEKLAEEEKKGVSLPDTSPVERPKDDPSVQ